MGYSHYGKQAEVWKHLPLCDIIAQEQPTTYIETNSASANYTLTHTPEQQYGIYHFIEKGKENPVNNSIYFRLENEAMQMNQYIGSPGLVMSILKDTCQYIFFDLDTEALQNIEEFGRKQTLTKQIILHNIDSLTGIMKLLPELSPNAFIHIDPYVINEPGSNGLTYLDIFIEATKLDLKCLLWYGYQTHNEKRELEELIRSSCKLENKHSISCHELTLKIIEPDTQPCTPGVLGSGLLASNISSISNTQIGKYCDLLIDFYKGSTYREYNGDLYKDIIL